MYYEVFWRTFRDSKRLLIYYAAGVALLAVMEMAIYPSIHGIEGLQQLFDQYPKELLAAFGIPSGGSFLTAAGFLQGELFGFMMPAVFLFYAIGMGGNLIAGEEQRGRLELLLAQPVSRTRILAQRGLVLVLGLAILVSTLFLSLWLFSLAFGVQLNTAALLSQSAITGFLALAFGFLALSLGAAFGSLGLAVGLPAVFAVLSYMVNAFAAMVENLDRLKSLSLFYYYGSAPPILHGLNMSNMLVLLAFGIVVFALGFPLFNRRDTGV